MPAHTISKLLATSGELEALYGKTQRLLRLQQAFFDATPFALAQACRVKSYKAGTLYIVTDSAAIAAKLRQLTPRLLMVIQKQESQITGIQVAVQVTKDLNQARKHPRKEGLSIDSIEKFRLLSEQTPDSPLKSALTNLVRRHSHPR